MAPNSINMDDLDSLTVVELKQLLKEKGLPVSGKKAELIARLEPEEDFIHLYDEEEDEEEKENVPEVKKPSGDKVEMDCPSCLLLIRVPSDYSGKVKCPACDHLFDASEIETRIPRMGLRGGLVEGDYPWPRFWLGFSVPSFLWMVMFIFGNAFVAIYIFVFGWGSEESLDGYFDLCFAPLVGIALTIYGHSIGDRALYQGALAGALAIPLIFIVGCGLFMLNGGIGYGN